MTEVVISVLLVFPEQLAKMNPGKPYIQICLMEIVLSFIVGSGPMPFQQQAMHFYAASLFVGFYSSVVFRLHCQLLTHTIKRGNRVRQLMRMSSG